MKFIAVIGLFFFAASLNGQMRINGNMELTPEMIYSAEGKYNSWSVSAGFGPLFMYSDITGYSVFPDTKVSFGPSLQITKHLLPAFAFELQYIQGNMYGEKDRFAFDGDLQDVSLNAIVLINQISSRPGPINDKWNYYLKAGVGATMFRSKLLHISDGRVVRQSDFDGTGPNRYVVNGYDKNDPARKTSRENILVMPIGVGLMYRINSSFDAGLETTMHFASEDNLDNILAGATNDRYLFTSFNVSYKFGKKKDRRHLRWTYRGYDMNLFGRPKKDPRVDEVNLLEEEIARYAANRPINKDSVIIVETLKIIYDKANLRSLFFDAGTAKPAFSEEDKILMGEVALEVRKHPQTKVILYGYADPGEQNGTAQNKMDLSRLRSEAVQAYLIAQFGVNPAQISVEAKGDSNPLSPTEKLSPRGLKMANQRVDMVMER